MVARKTTQRIIGGMFGLEDIFNPKSSNPHFLNKDAIPLLNASSGIWLLIKILKPTHVWMPSYLCDSMLKAVDRNLTAIRFYEVNYDLAIPSFDWILDVQQNDLVVIIDYFGFPPDKPFIAPAKKQGAWILEDACQALLSTEVGQFSHFVLYSPRKFLGVPDGGILLLNHRINIEDIRLKRPPAAWWLKALSASILRREHDLNGKGHRWYDLFQKIEAEYPIGPYAMSELSEMLLRHSFDYSMIIRRRIENYHFLVEELGSIALFPKLPDRVVPLGFPIRVKNRDLLRKALFDHKIYPPIHWPIHGIIPDEFRDSHRLSAEIMTLPCDQRCNRHDIERVIYLVSNLLGC